MRTITIRATRLGDERDAAKTVAASTKIYEPSQQQPLVIWRLFKSLFSARSPNYQQTNKCYWIFVPLDRVSEISSALCSHYGCCFGFIEFQPKREQRTTRRRRSTQLFGTVFIAHRKREFKITLFPRLPQTVYYFNRYSSVGFSRNLNNSGKKKQSSICETSIRISDLRTISVNIVECFYDTMRVSLFYEIKFRLFKRTDLSNYSNVYVLIRR